MSCQTLHPSVREAGNPFWFDIPYVTGAVIILLTTEVAKYEVQVERSMVL